MPLDKRETISKDTPKDTVQSLFAQMPSTSGIWRQPQAGLMAPCYRSCKRRILSRFSFTRFHILRVERDRR